MDEKISLRLVQLLREQSAAHEDDYDLGKALGADWAAGNIFPAGDSAPFTPDLRDTPYNVGVLHGVATELRRFADELTTARCGKPGGEPLFRVVERDGRRWLQQLQRSAPERPAQMWTDVAELPSRKK